jgi:hypothetical protein
MLEKWSHAHEWQDRVKAHDKAVGDAIPQKEMSPEFDQVDKLMSAAHLALTRALSGNPKITKASDMKALIDASANALMLADSIKAKQGDNTSREQIVAEMERVLGLAAERRRKDAVDTMLAFGVPVDAMRKMGLTEADGLPSVDLGVEPAKPDVEVVGEVEAAPDATAATQQPVVVESGVVAPVIAPQPDGQALPQFSDVIARFRSVRDDGGEGDLSGCP